MLLNILTLEWNFKRTCELKKTLEILVDNAEYLNSHATGRNSRLTKLPFKKGQPKEIAVALIHISQIENSINDRIIGYLKMCDTLIKELSRIQIIRTSLS